MENFSQPGDVLTLTAPSGGVVSGQPYLIGSLLVIANETKAQTLPFEAEVRGVHLGTKPANEAWTEAAPIYWDDSERKFTIDSDSAANPLVGVAVRAVPVSIALASSGVGSPGDLVISDDVVTVGSYAELAGVVLTITQAKDNGVTRDYVLTEGVDWFASAGSPESNAETAASIAAAVSAIPGLTGVNTLGLATSVPGSPADIVVSGNTITIGGFAELALSTVTVTVNGVATVLTEGTDWDINAGSPESNDETAASLEAAIEAIPGVESSVAANVITVTVTAVQVVADNPVPGHVRLDGAAR